MAKGKQFNKGTIDIKDEKITWQIPTSKVQCVSINVLDYLYKDNTFTVPLEDIELIEKQLTFRWTLPKNYKNLTSVRKKSTWYQLKTAKNFLEIVQYFEQNKDMKTVYNPVNFYVDEYLNVKVLLYTNPLHLPYESNSDSSLLNIQKTLASIFVTINDKKIDHQQTAQEKEEENMNVTLLDKIFNTHSVSELKQMIDREYDHFLALQDEQQMQIDHITKKTRKKYLSMFIGFTALILIALYFLQGIKTTEYDKEIAELEIINANHDIALSAYDAYSDGDIQTALDKIEEIEDDSKYVHPKFYIQVLVQSGKIEEAINKFPEQDDLIIDYFVRSAEEAEILALDIDNPHVTFEKAIINKDDAILEDTFPQIKRPTNRQSKYIYDHYVKKDINKALKVAQNIHNEQWELEALKIKEERLKKKVKDLDKKDDKEEIKKLNQEIKNTSEAIKSLDK